MPRVKFHLKLSVIGMALALSACSDGGNTGAGSTYTGAATVGDMAEFTVNGSTLNYSLQGAHFGNTTGSMTIDQVSGTTNFYYADVNNTTIGMMLANNFGIALVPDVPDLLSPPNTVNTFVPALMNASNNEADVMGKAFLYVTYQSGPDAYVLKLYGDNHFAAQRVRDYLADLAAAGNAGLNSEPGTTNLITGCWRASNSGNYLNAVTAGSDANISSAVNSSTCSQFDFVAAGYDTNPASTASGYYRFMVKPGVNRTGLIVDMADGSGFGIGLQTTLEATAPVSSAPAAAETYSVFSAPNVTTIDLSTLFDVNTGASPFTQAVVKPNLLVEITPMTCNYSVTPVSCSVTGTAQIMDTFYDKYCYEDPLNPGQFIAADLPGMTCVFSGSLNSPSRIYNAFIDDQDGYFFAASLLAPEFVMGAQ